VSYNSNHTGVTRSCKRIFLITQKKVFGPKINELHAQLLPGDSEHKFEALQDWLLQTFNQNAAPPAPVVSMVEAFQNAQGLHYGEIVKDYPHSQKHLISQFKKYVGLTPKYFHRICRFNELLAAINRKEQFSWAQIAYECGFSDQSHFIKEFKHFSGFNPREFIKQELNQAPPNFFPLDREG